jgi:hypothetical protein
MNEALLSPLFHLQSSKGAHAARNIVIVEQSVQINHSSGCSLGQHVTIDKWLLGADISDVTPGQCCFEADRTERRYEGSLNHYHTILPSPRRYSSG